jgi:hypothetical protein
MVNKMSEKWYITYAYGGNFVSEITDEHPVVRIQELNKEEVIRTKHANELAVKEFNELSQYEKEVAKKNSRFGRIPIYCATPYSLIFAMKVP